MKVPTILIHTGELPHRIQYICPICSSGNYDTMPGDLVRLSCSNCGALLDGTQAAIEIIAEKRTAQIVSKTRPTKKD